MTITWPRKHGAGFFTAESCALLTSPLTPLPSSEEKEGEEEEEDTGVEVEENEEEKRPRVIFYTMHDANRLHYLPSITFLSLYATVVA